jgi:lipopolysaccharide transport system ATP-binding protein
LFVSHDIFTVRSFCHKAIWLTNGKIKEQGDVTEVTAHYNEYMHQDQNSSCENRVAIDNNIEHREFNPINRWGEKEGIIEYVGIYNENMTLQNSFKLNEYIVIRMIVNMKNIENEKLSLAISIKNKNGIDLIVSTTEDESFIIDSSNDKVEAVFKFKNYLSTGEYVLVVAVENRELGTPEYLDYIEGADYFKSEISQMLFGMFHQPVEQMISYRK